MYFSIIRVREGREREAAAAWTNTVYEEHQWLWQFFPAPRGTQREFLFHKRIGPAMPHYYVLSDRAPEGDAVGWEVLSKRYSPRVTVGTRLRFELRANPVVTRRVGAKRSRHDVVMDAKRQLLAARGMTRWQDWDAPDKPSTQEIVHRSCAAWLLVRAAGLGFSVSETSLQVEGYQQQVGKSAALRFSTVDFAGELAVTDTALFTRTMVSGIGHAKAFGCGLLLVRPLE